MERSDREERSEIDPELKNVSTKKFKALTHGCDIYEALQASNDIDYLSSIMTMEQRVQVEKHKDKIQLGLSVSGVFEKLVFVVTSKKLRFFFRIYIANL